MCPGHWCVETFGGWGSDTSSRMTKKLAILSSHLWPEVLSCHLGLTLMCQYARALLARSKLWEVEVYVIRLLLHALLMC